MKRKKTSVSIARVPMPTDLMKLVKEIAVISVDKGIEQERISMEIAKARALYKNSLDEIPEDANEREFREKAIAFFERTDLLPIGDLGYNGYQFHCANYHIESVCAAFRLFNLGEKLNITNIYNVGRYKMQPNEEYMASIEGRNMICSEEWHLTSKTTNIYGLRNYFIALTYDIFRKDEKLFKRCNTFLKEYEYHPFEEVWYQMVYIICNS